MMDYNLKANWNVTVSIEVCYDGTKYNFSFDFMVNTGRKWGDIITTAHAIIRDKFGHRGYKVTNISLRSEE